MSKLKICIVHLYEKSPQSIRILDKSHLDSYTCTISRV